MCGFGDIYVEAVMLAGLSLAPDSFEETAPLILQTIFPAFIRGLRGGEAKNLDSIAHTIASLGHMLEDHPQIEEPGLHPVLRYSRGCVVVGARIILSNQEDLDQCAIAHPASHTLN